MGLPNLPHSNSNLTNSRYSWHPPFLNQNSCCPSPLASSTSLVTSLPLAFHFKLQCLCQNIPIIPPQHMPVPSHSICLAISTTVSFNPSISIRSCPKPNLHIALTIVLSVLLKTAFSFSLKHHVSLLHNILDLTKL